MQQKKDFLDELAQTVMLAALVIAGLCTLLSFIFQFISEETTSLFTQISYYAYGWMVFVALGPSVKRSAFMKIDLLTSALYPESVQKTLRVLGEAIMFVLIAVMFVFSMTNFITALSEHTMNAAAPVLPVAIAYLASVLGYGLGVIAYIMRVLSGKEGK